MHCRKYQLFLFCFFTVVACGCDSDSGDEKKVYTSGTIMMGRQITPATGQIPPELTLPAMAVMMRKSTRSLYIDKKKLIFIADSFHRLINSREFI